MFITSVAVVCCDGLMFGRALVRYKGGLGLAGSVCLEGAERHGLLSIVIPSIRCVIYCPENEISYQGAQV